MKIYDNVKPNYIKNFFSKLNGKILGDVYIATPFFNEPDIIQDLNANGYRVYLIVRLSEATSPEAIEKIIDLENVQIRFFNDHYFHSKFYITPTDCMLGSANMTKNGLCANSEVNIAFDKEIDYEIYDELKNIFYIYWENASVFTSEKLKEYKKYFKNTSITKSNFDSNLQNSKTLQTNSASSSKIDTNLDKQNIMVQAFQRDYQNFQKYMNTLKDLYLSYNKRILPRDIPIKYEIDRFLSFLQTECYYKSVDKSYQKTEILYGKQLKDNIRCYLDIWFNAEIDKNNDEWEYTLETIPEKYKIIQNAFSSQENIDKLSLSEIFNILFKTHAFHDQFRNHCKENEFESLFERSTDVIKLKKTLKYLFFSKDNFFIKIVNVAYNPKYKIQYIGEMSATELSGWVDNSDERYLCNSRVLKSLRFLGCNISI